MKTLGKISNSYTVSFMRINSSPFQVGEFAEVDIHRQQVNAGNSAGAKTQVITFQKEQMNRKIKILSVVSNFPDEK